MDAETTAKVLQAARQMGHRLDELSLIFSYPGQSSAPIHPDQEISELFSSEAFPRCEEVNWSRIPLRR